MILLCLFLSKQPGCGMILLKKQPDILCPPVNYGISRFVSWFLEGSGGMIVTKGGVHNEPTENR